jgi:hypothetical protein
MQGTLDIDAGFNLWKFIKKYWYFIFTLIILIPIITGTITETIKTQNWILPVFKFGTYILGADNIIQNTLNLLKTEPVKLIGMAYPTIGIFQHVKYYWLFFANVIWTLFTAIWMIFFPFSIIYMLVRTHDDGKKAQNLIVSLIIFLVLMFIVNSIFAIHNIYWDKSNLDLINKSGSNEFLYIFENIIPFHGIINLIIYIISILR